MGNNYTPKSKKIGRPKLEIKWKTVDRLCKIQCTGPEIASILEVSEDTLTRAANREKKCSFAEYIKSKSVDGKTSLRRLQWRAAKKGNITMLIWLGKQYLEQVDKQELTGDAARPLHIQVSDKFMPKSLGVKNGGHKKSK